MIKNRSVPVDTVLPHIVYRDVGKAIAWLETAFGFVEHYRYGAPDAPSGAQGRIANAWIMLTSTKPGRSTPKQSGSVTQMLTVFVEDVDAQYSLAKAAGAKIVEEMNEPAYGERQFCAEDLEGHHWLFSRHI
jgi:uncharacterized glyoxalase superfamily protein PhnB